MNLELFFLSEEQWKHKIKTEELNIDLLYICASHIPYKIWNYLAIYQKLPSKFIIDFNEFFQIDTLLMAQRIHEKTIDENINIFKKYMWHACRYQYLSESFLYKHKEIIDWKQTFLHQKHLSLHFILNNFNNFPRHEKINNPTEAFSKEVCHRYNLSIDNMIEKHNMRANKLRTLKR
jgi:hypothetical protein